MALNLGRINRIIETLPLLAKNLFTFSNTSPSSLSSVESFLLSSILFADGSSSETRKNDIYIYKGRIKF